MEYITATNKSISQLMNEFKDGLIDVPEIQRDVVWKSDQIKDLIDSISRGFPCGSLILWEPREKDKNFLRSIIRPERLEKNAPLPKYFILDGQQRLTALSVVLLKRELLKNLLNELEEEMPYIYINLKRFPKEIEARSSASHDIHWVLYNSLFDGTLEDTGEYKKLDDAMKCRIKKHVQNIFDYQFPVQIIHDRNYADVSEIFTRVNSQGTPLTGAEIHLAKIVPHWPGITRKFREYRKELRINYYDLDLNFLMRTITAIECNVPQIKKLSEKISKDHISKNRLNATWEKVKKSTNRLIKILKKELYLDKSKYFTSKNTLVPLVYYISTKKRSVAIGNIKKFFLLSQLSEHYGGAAESTLRKDFKTLTEASKPRFGLIELVNNVNYESRQYYRGLKIKGEDISGIPSKNVLVLFMYVLMKRNKATDWGSRNRLSLEEIEPRNTQLHHIFQSNLMLNDKNALKRYTEEKECSQSEYREAVNDIANITFLSKAKNIAIGDVAPSQYLINETTREIRKAHFIPEKPELWKTENYIDFLEERKRLIAEAITRFIKNL